MGCALVIAAVLHQLVAGPAGVGPAPSAGEGAAEAPAPPSRRATLLNLKPLDEGTVRRALNMALAMLASPGCSQVYSEFRRPDGRTPRDELERMGIGPEEFLESLVFADGSGKPVCRTSWAVLTATPGRSLVFVCPAFAQFQIDRPRRSAAVIIHESLHALGLGENPPPSDEITRRVERHCWKLGRWPPAAQRLTQMKSGITPAVSKVMK